MGSARYVAGPDRFGKEGIMAEVWTKAGIVAGVLALAVIGLGATRTGAEPVPVGAARMEQACRVFPLNVEDGPGGYFETSDRTGPIGQWIGEREDAGWVLDQVDYETGTRSTGFPTHQVLICVARPKA